MKWVTLSFALLLLVLILPTQGMSATATAVIKGTLEGSQIAGQVKFEETEKGLKVDAAISGASAGEHGFHIHEHGSCAESGNAAGSHFNPDQTKHGFLPIDGFKEAHAGDLGNIIVNSNGEGKLSVEIPNLSLSKEPYNVVHHAIILHANKDDFGQPTGNAGGRIACGVIELDQK